MWLDTGAIRVERKPGAIGFDRACRRKCGVPRLLGGLVKHLAKKVTGNDYTYAMAA